MEWSILFMGPVGAGKTQAIRSVSDIEVVDTDVGATDATRLVKRSTTVALDVGTLGLGGQDKLRIYGAPGQERFDFMWDILLQQAKAVALLINDASPAPMKDLDRMLDALEARTRTRKLPMAIGVTHTDAQPGDASLAVYRSRLAQRGCTVGETPPPIMEVDARRPEHVRALLMALAAMLEMAQRYPGAVARTAA